jgi:hypothetical protein
MIVPEYYIIDGHTKKTVIDDVTAHLQQGWTLHGDLVVTSVLVGNSIIVRYVQALFRNVDVPGAWG